MTSYGSRSALKTRDDNSQSEFKQLKSKHGAKLATLKELFSDWSDEDLLFAIRDADGDLEMTIGRIAEGHAVRWDEVKSKKASKEQKPRPASANHVASGTRPPRSSHAEDRPRARGSKATRGLPTQRPAQQQTTTWAKQSKQPPRSAQPSTTNDSGSSWANIASAPKASTATNGAALEDAGWGTTAPSNGNDASHAEPILDHNQENVQPPQPPEADAPANDSAHDPPTAPSKTWASLLKSAPKPKPEPKPEPVEEPAKSGWDAPSHTGEGWDAPVTTTSLDAKQADTDGWGDAVPREAENTQKEEEQTEERDARDAPAAADAVPSSSDWNAPPSGDDAQKEETDGWNALEGEEPKQTEDLPSDSAKQQESEPVIAEKKSRLTQDEPVVMPSSTSALAGVDVKFGSLHLDDHTSPLGDDRLAGGVDLQLGDQKQVQQAQQQQAQQQRQQSYASHPTSYDTHGYGRPNEITEQAKPDAYEQPYPAGPPLRDPLSYNPAYLTGQHPGSSDFSGNPMVSMPDYNMYNLEAQRAAMGYYDPMAYHTSPSVTAANTYPGRDKYADMQPGMPQQQAQQQQAQQQGQQQQQMYPNMGYYQYYYMPNHFNGYQQSYAQPFMNKNMYPMYQQQGQAPQAQPQQVQAQAAGAAGKPQAAYSDQSPYQPHLYNPSMMQYEESLNGGLLGDYQKVAPFLSNLPPTSQGKVGDARAQQQQQQQQQPTDPYAHIPAYLQQQHQHQQQPQQPQQQPQQQQQQGSSHIFYPQHFLPYGQQHHLPQHQAQPPPHQQQPPQQPQQPQQPQPPQPPAPGQQQVPSNARQQQQQYWTQ